MAFNPFNSADGSSFEQGNPLTSTVKKATNAVTAQAVQQTKAASQTFTDQLYGNVAPSTEETDKTNESGAQQAAQAQKAQAAQAGQSGNNKTPAEQSQIDVARKKLQDIQGLHNKSYYEGTFGEEAQQKRRQQEEQERQMKAQEEEDKREQQAQEKANRDNEMGALNPAGKGKGNGRNRMSQPLAVTQAKTKTEINRGASG